MSGIIEREMSRKVAFALRTFANTIMSEFSFWWSTEAKGQKSKASFCDTNILSRIITGKFLFEIIHLRLTICL